MKARAPRRARPDRHDIESEIARLARARSDALVHKDLAALGRLLAPGFVYTNASGEVLEREAYLDRYVRSPDVRWESQGLEDLAVRLRGSVAILTCRVRDRAWFGNEPLDASFRSTYVYARIASGWRCVAGHTGPA